MADSDRRTMYMDLTMGFDGFGEPLIHMAVHIPEDGAVKLDDVEGMAIHMLNTVAQARANAAISRKMMLDGKSPQEAMEFLRSVMLSTS